MPYVARLAPLSLCDMFNSYGVSQGYWASIIRKFITTCNQKPRQVRWLSDGRGQPSILHTSSRHCLQTQAPSTQAAAVPDVTATHGKHLVGGETLPTTVSQERDFPKSLGWRPPAAEPGHVGTVTPELAVSEGWGTRGGRSLT